MSSGSDSSSSARRPSSPPAPTTHSSISASRRMSVEDPLALPRVPPPVPDDHPRRDRLLALLFVVALPLIALVNPLGSFSTVSENRNPAPWPQLAPIKDFPAHFEQAFSDRFRGRTLLLFVDHAVVATLFHTSPVSNVMMGREGWLYWLGEDGRSLDRNFRLTLATPDAELAKLGAELKRRRDFLAARGIAYLVT